MLKQFIRLKNARSLTLVVSAILCSLSSAASGEERQYKIEAAFIYSFFNYITWPGYSSPQDLKEPVVCAFFGDPIIPYLNYIRIKMAAERTLTVREITEDLIPQDCNIIFMRRRISFHILASFPPYTLTVLKPDDPLDRGGIIELSEDGERIAIKINQSRLEENDFHASSRLLDLARK